MPSSAFAMLIWVHAKGIPKDMLWLYESITISKSRHQSTLIDEVLLSEKYALLSSTHELINGLYQPSSALARIRSTVSKPFVSSPYWIYLCSKRAVQGPQSQPFEPSAVKTKMFRCCGSSPHNGIRSEP